MNPMPTPATTNEAMTRFDELLDSYRETVIKSLSDQLVGKRPNEAVTKNALTALRAHVAKMAEDGARLDWLLQDAVIRFENTYTDRAAIDVARECTP